MDQKCLPQSRVQQTTLALSFSLVIIWNSSSERNLTGQGPMLWSTSDLVIRDQGRIWLPHIKTLMGLKTIVWQRLSTPKCPQQYFWSLLLFRIFLWAAGPLILDLVGDFWQLHGTKKLWKMWFYMISKVAACSFCRMILSPLRFLQLLLS